MESHFHQTELASSKRRINVFVLLTNERQIMGDIYINCLTTSCCSKFKLTGLKASGLSELK